MDWEQTTDTDSTFKFERQDGYAEIIARETAAGNWTIHLDKLEQAPEGQRYEHETVSDRATALERAREWQTDETE